MFFILAYFSKIIKLLFPLRYPIFCDTLFFGGMDTSICMCSLQASASIISTCFYSHNFLSMIPISAFFPIDYLSAVFWCKYYVIFAIPFCVLNDLCQVSYLIPPSFSCSGWQTHFFFIRRWILFLLLAIAFWFYQTAGCFRYTTKIRHICIMQICRIFNMAPPAGLEPATSWLTVMRSTDWANEEYLSFLFLLFYSLREYFRLAPTYFPKPSPA